MYDPAGDERLDVPTGGIGFALTGAMLLSLVLGSIHAFSVLLPEMERTFDTGRMSASLTYSLALATLAIAVLIGHRLYAKVAPAIYVAATGLLAAAGCLAAGLAAGFGGSVGMVWIGYGVLFGGANGLGYGYALQFSAQAAPNRKGLAMGAVNAAYALGAVVFPIPLAAMLETSGWTAALFMLALAVIMISAISSILLARSQMRYQPAAPHSPPGAAVSWQTVALLWLGYCSAVTTGLMVMAQATGIAEAEEASRWLVIGSPVIIAASNMIGSTACGAMFDRVRGRMLLAALALLTSTALLAMAFLPLVAVTITGLAIIGFAYGGVISVYPASISRRFGLAAGAVIYGRVFTAWAAAGILGPGLAGFLYDLDKSYTMPLIIAAAIAILSPIFLLRAGRL